MTNKTHRMTNSSHDNITGEFQRWKRADSCIQPHRKKASIYYSLSFSFTQVHLSGNRWWNICIGIHWQHDIFTRRWLNTAKASFSPSAWQITTKALNTYVEEPVLWSLSKSITLWDDPNSFYGHDPLKATPNYQSYPLIMSCDVDTSRVMCSECENVAKAVKVCVTAADGRWKHVFGSPSPWPALSKPFISYFTVFTTARWSPYLENNIRI